MTQNAYIRPKSLYTIILYIRVGIWVISCHDCYRPLSFDSRMSHHVYRFEHMGLLVYSNIRGQSTNSCVLNLHVTKLYQQNRCLVIKTQISNLVLTMRFWNNFHLVVSVKIFKNKINLNYVKASKINFFIITFFCGGGLITIFEIFNLM